MFCGLRLECSLSINAAVALGSALTARGPSGGPALGPIGRALRARSGMGYLGPGAAAEQSKALGYAAFREVLGWVVYLELDFKVLCSSHCCLQ